MAAVIASTVDASTPVACQHVSYWVCGCGQVISYRGGWRDQLIVVVVITPSRGRGSELDNTSVPGSRNCTRRNCVVPSQLGIADTCT